MSVSISGAGSISGLDQGFNVTSGNLGIGTDNTAYSLDLGESSSTIRLVSENNGTAIRIGAGGGSNDVSLIRVDGNSNTASQGETNDSNYGFSLKYMGSRSGNNNSLSIFSDNQTGTQVESVTILQDGKVGINTDNPKQKLSVVGRVNIDNQGDYYGAWINGDSGADSSFNVGAWYNVGGRLRDNGNHVVLESMNTSHYVQLQPSGGNVGVGEAGPNAKLHITKDNDVAYTPSQATQDSNNQIKIENHSTTTDSFVSMAMRARACDFHLGVKNNGADNSGRLFLVHQDTTNKEVVSVLSTGNVGIGTDNPNKILRVEYPDPGSGSNGLTQKDTGNDTTTFFGTVGPSYNYIGHSGHAGMVYSSRDLAIGVDHNNSGVIKFYTGSAERIRIKNNGHVHIGNPVELANVATTTHTFALSGNSDNTFSCPGSVSISGATAYNTANYAGGGLRFLGKYNASGQYTTFAHVGGIKENTTDGNYAGALTFHTRNHGGLGAERMRISSNGQVTMPVQPCFFATSNTGGSHTSNGYTGIISNQLEAAYVNIGNHFNTSTGVFTCPVAGTYEFHGQGLIRYQTGTGRSELTFYKNGSNTISRSYGYTYVTGSNDHDNLHVMAYITCAANDQIDLRVYAMDAGVDCYFAQGLGWFAGRLVQ